MLLAVVALTATSISGLSILHLVMVGSVFLATVQRASILCDRVPTAVVLLEEKKKEECVNGRAAYTNLA